MVHNLIAALRDDLQTLPWMGSDTRTQATRKLEAFAVKNRLHGKSGRDYSALKNRPPVPTPEKPICAVRNSIFARRL